MSNRNIKNNKDFIVDERKVISDKVRQIGFERFLSDIKFLDYQYVDLIMMLFTEIYGDGGINTNPTGTGKTIEYVLLVFVDFLLNLNSNNLGLSNLQSQNDNKVDQKPTDSFKTKDFEIINVKAKHQCENTKRITLYICPNSRLVSQVRNEFSRIQFNDFKVIEVLDSKIDQEELKKYNVVITTKNRLIKNQGIKDIEWYRVIFDEAHHIKNINSIVRIILTKINTKKLWLITATPDMNGLYDFKNLINLFRNKRPFIIRNHKRQIFDTLNIPELEERILPISFTELEVKIYRKLLDFLVDGLFFVTNQTRFLWLLSTLLLRRFCDGISIKISEETSVCYQSNKKCFYCEKIKNCLYVKCCRVNVCCQCINADHEDLVFNCPLCLKIISLVELFIQDRPVTSITSSKVSAVNEVQLKDKIDHEKLLKNQKVLDQKLTDQKIIQKNSINKSLKEELEDFLDKLNTKSCTKFQKLLEYINVISSKKILIFSEWSKVAKNLENFLTENVKDRKIYRIDGTIRDKNREKILQDFKTKNEPAILIMTLKTGGEGLNLIEATHVIILEPYWNSKTEQQAIDRVYRIGQKRKTYAARFYIEGTIEELLLKVQDMKNKYKRFRVTQVLKYSKLVQALNKKYKI